MDDLPSEHSLKPTIIALMKHKKGRQSTKENQKLRRAKLFFGHRTAIILQKLLQATMPAKSPWNTAISS